MGAVRFQTLLISLAIVLISPTRCAFAACDLGAQRKALEIIWESADRLCGTVSPESTAKTQELSAAAKAELNSVLSRIANLGGEVAAKTKESATKGVLQEDLARALKDTADCKMQVFGALKDKLLPSCESAGSPVTPQPDTNALLRQAEKKASEFFSAIQAKDVDSLTRMASPPFFLDNQILTSPAAIRQAYARVFEPRPRPRPRGEVQLVKLKAMTVGALQDEGRLLKKDRLMNALSMTRDDIMVVMTLRSGEREEGALLGFRRAGDQLEFAGWWD